MTSSIQGIIIALLIAFLVGILVGYSFVQARLRKQTEALKISQRRLEEIEQSHELRLREATEKLRRDYEAELAETIEHYQDQLSQKTIEMEQIYKTRFQVLQRGETPAAATPLVGTQLGLGADVPSVPVRETVQPRSEGAPRPLTQPELLHLKRQYEMRLREAAQKLQKAYEQQLAEHARKARADLHAEYDRQLAEKLQEYEQQFAERQAQLEADYANRQREIAAMMAAEEAEIPTPSEIMGTGDETTVTLQPPSPFAGDDSSLTAVRYTQEELEARIQAAREEVREAYEQNLASQLEEQQEQFDVRLQDLEADYKQQIATLSAAANKKAESSFEDDLFGDDLFDLDDDKNNDDDDDLGPLDLSDISELS
jgi:hypothetical protein